MSGILPELVLCSSPVLLDRLFMLMQVVWREGGIPIARDWRDALIVPVPKKGDLQYCDNWRGMMLINFC